MSDSKIVEEDDPTADSSDDEVYNPTKIEGDNIWEPDPQTIAELYEKLDKVCYPHIILFDDTINRPNKTLLHRACVLPKSLFASIQQ